MAQSVRFQDSLDTFSDRAERIQLGYQLRQREPTHEIVDGEGIFIVARPPWDRYKSYFLREAYALITETLMRERGDRIIKHLAKASAFLPVRSLYSEKPFYWGILAVDPDCSCTAEDGKELARTARLFAHANMNQIPPGLLTGFLSQIGGYRYLDDRCIPSKLDPSLEIQE